jgi:hypothetical protein
MAVVEFNIVAPPAFQEGFVRGPTALSVTILQRIYDNTLLSFVYYSGPAIDLAPLAGETSPNHMDDLDVSTHAIVARI